MLTSAGLEVPTLEEIQDALLASARSVFGEKAAQDSNDPLRRIIDIFGGQEAALWELAQALFDANNPDAAAGVLLDNLCAIVGVVRLPATFTTGSVTCTGLPGVEIPAGQRVAVEDGATFILLESVVLDGAGTGTAKVQAEEAGAVQVAAGQLSQIIQPVAGWQQVTNAEDLVTGDDRESDDALRVRRRESLQGQGSGVLQSITAEVRKVLGVQAAFAIENTTTQTVDGQPPHSVQVIVWPDSGVSEEDVARAIATNKAGGVLAFGARSFLVSDSYGNEVQAGFSYATRVNIYVAADLTTNASFPADGIAQVEAAILAVGNGVLDSQQGVQADALRHIVGQGIGVGEDVSRLAIQAAIKTVPGVQAADVRVGTVSPAALTTDLEINPKSIAVFDSGRVIVQEV